MTTHSKTIVYTDGAFTIIRWKSWGFNCNSLTTLWIVQDNRTGEELSTFSRLRDAKEYISKNN